MTDSEKKRSRPVKKQVAAKKRAPPKKVVPAKSAAAKKRPSAKMALAGAPVPPNKDPMPEHIAGGLAQGLSLREIEFIEVYLTCYNGTRSYMEVYKTTNANLAGVEASRMLRKPKVHAYLSGRVKAAFQRTETAQDRLIESITAVAYGDMNELVELRREACRYCHGDGHQYQFTPQEWRNAEAEHKKNVTLAAKDGVKLGPLPKLGGVGFNPRLEPHQECPECHGEGRERMHIHDTRNLSPAALALYQGVEMTKDGLKLKTANQDGARDRLAKVMKLYDDEKTEVNVHLSTADLQDRYQERMALAHQRAAEVRKERGIKDGD